MTRRWLAGGVAVVLVAALAPRAGAQTPQADVVDVLIDFLLKQTLQELPASAPSAKQVTAPAAANGTSTVVSAPSFPELVGLAFDNNMAGLKDGVFTLDLNLFAFHALAKPAAAIDQTRYARGGNAAMRRIGFSLSVGGKGEKFDRNGDGKADEPAAANTLTDILTSELRIRMFGSRDRRDASNFTMFKDAAGVDYAALAAATRAFLVAHASELPMTKPNANGDRTLDVQKFNDVLGRPELAPEIKTLSDAYARYVRARDAAITAVDRQAVWTLVVGGTRHADAFGPDRVHAGVRGVKSAGVWDNTFNIDWRRAEPFMERPAGTSWLAAYEISTLLFKTTLSDEGVKLSFGTNLEWHRNVPATHRKIARASVGFAVPMSPKVSVPITLSYANHTDLLDAKRLWAGQIGLAWDLSGSGKKN